MITGPDNRFGVSVGTILIGGVVLKLVLGLRAVLGVAGIDPSGAKADGVDGVARLDSRSTASLISYSSRFEGGIQ